MTARELAEKLCNDPREVVDRAFRQRDEQQRDWIKKLDALINPGPPEELFVHRKPDVRG